MLGRPRLLRNEDDLGYLLRALRNVFLTQKRTEGRRVRTGPLTDRHDLVEDPSAREPQTAVEAGELYAAVAALPDDFRDVLVAVDITGLSYEEAARALRIREGTVMSRLYRARQQVVRRIDGLAVVAAGVDRPDEHLLARGGLIAVGSFAGHGQRPELLRRDAGPQRHSAPSLNVPIGTSTPAGVLQPRLVEAAVVEPRQPGRIELDPPARGRLRERCLAGAPGASPVEASAAWKVGGGPETRTATPTPPPPSPRRRRRQARGGAVCDGAVALRVDACPQGGRRLDLRGGTPHERERPPLLGQPVRELGRRGDGRLERGAPVVRDEPSASAASSAGSGAPASSSPRRFIWTSPRTVTAHVLENTYRAAAIPGE